MGELPRVKPSLPYHNTGTLQARDSAKPMLADEEHMQGILIHQQDPCQSEFPASLKKHH